MAFIPYVPYDDATGLLARLFDRFRTERGEVDNVIRIHSVSPPAMAHHVELYAAAMRGASPLSRIQREMIAVTVSAVNRCFY